MNKLQLLQFLREHRLAVEATAFPNESVQAAIVGVAFTDELEIVFDCLESSRKVRNLRRNPKIAFAVGGWNPGDERTAQYEGVADEPRGEELDRLKAIYFGVFADGPARQSWPGLIYVRVRPVWSDTATSIRTHPGLWSSMRKR